MLETVSHPFFEHAGEYGRIWSGPFETSRVFIG